MRSAVPTYHQDCARRKALMRRTHEVRLLAGLSEAHQGDGRGGGALCGVAVRRCIGLWLGMFIVFIKRIIVWFYWMNK